MIRNLLNANENSCFENERENLLKFQKFQLPSYYKNIGFSLFITTLVLLIAFKVFAEDMGTIRFFMKKILLVSLLLISISKDKIEDELTISLRAQSYTLAFIIGVLYAIVQPFIDLGVDFLVNVEEASYSDLNTDQIITFMLLIQIGVFNLLKRLR